MRRLISLLLAASLLAGCATRSISNPGGGSGHGDRGNSMYRGELSEFDVLGVDFAYAPTEEAIAKALARKDEKLQLKRGSRVLLIQSGAPFPDQPMIDGLNRYFSVVPFGGVPERDKPAASSYARSLRLAAAQVGADTIIAYWGVLESMQEGAATKTVSWVPIVGWVLPDESQDLRIRLRLAVIDVATGKWEVVSPKPNRDVAYSSIMTRRQSDAQQIQKLKELAYAEAAEDIARIYGR